MGVRDRQDIEIPAQYDPTRTDIVLGDAFEDSVALIREKAEIQHQHDHNYTVLEADSGSMALSTGRRRLSHRNTGDSRDAQKQRDEDRLTIETALQHFRDQMDEFYRELIAINRRLRDLAIEISELEQIRQLAEQGLLDPQNSAQAAVLRKYGITQDDIASGHLTTIIDEKLGLRAEEQTELQERKESVSSQAYDAIDQALDDNIITPQEAAQFQQHMEEAEAGVSAAAWDSNEAQEELRDIAADHYSNVLQNTTPVDELSFVEKSAATSGSVVAALDGDASYHKPIQSQEKALSLQQPFTASTNPKEQSPVYQAAVTGKLSPGPQKE